MQRVEDKEKRDLVRNRVGILWKLDRWLEQPMILLGFAWLVLLVVDLTRGLSPVLEHASTAIWIVFILEFLLRFTIAPAKIRFLRKNWLSIIALAIPALRVFRVFRVVRVLRMARATRGLRLVRLITSLNRGMSALGETLEQNKFGYVLALTILITLTGAAGMFAFERAEAAPGKFDSYGNAVWWTSMMMTTMGADFFPKTSEGRFLALLLALYAFAIWGYVTATIATFFLGRGRSAASESSSVEALRVEIGRLRQDLARYGGKPGAGSGAV